MEIFSLFLLHWFSEANKVETQHEGGKPCIQSYISSFRDLFGEQGTEAVI